VGLGGPAVDDLESVLAAEPAPLERADPAEQLRLGM
jgi:hypothetical protein